MRVKLLKVFAKLFAPNFKINSVMSPIIQRNRNCSVITISRKSSWIFPSICDKMIIQQTTSVIAVNPNIFNAHGISFLYDV